MRYIVTVAALILSYGTTASYAQGRSAYIHNWGIDSCGKYLAAVHGHPPGTGTGYNDPQRGTFYDDHHLYMAWLGGFFSATNLWVTDGPNGIKGDEAAIDVWIRKWCEQNPTKSLSDAAAAFAWDQRQDYLQSWFHRQSR
jgi:hypothetical protein